MGAVFSHSQLNFAVHRTMTTFRGLPPAVIQLPAGYRLARNQDGSYIRNQNGTYMAEPIP